LFSSGHGPVAARDLAEIDPVSKTGTLRLLYGIAAANALISVVTLASSRARSRDSPME